ncbi:2OG-Fe(II) oxygenase [Hyphobacterium sp. SN044]|uniref:2OG-Fe(II) oxygenase n=1 Tax=Hyphobacterium sp. SN044 TaxID=2912575 RepID=UPI001F2D6D7B|nr:2OG-Fe(II) oxygenase [Hyphobacterium sp. SN044]MCF8880533.1 2OG-Fe(II) oxygenase [Hyphobacterium sp. SN044]
MPAVADTCPRPLFGANLEAALVEGLAERGWAAIEQAIDPELVPALRARAQTLYARNAFDEGRVGRGEALTGAPRIRRAEIAWLEGEDAAERRLLDGAEALRQTLNRELFLGLFEFEAHFAHYPEGGFYRRHLDAFAGGVKSRVVSFVAYLNEAWAEGDGGELAMWTGPDDTGEPTALIAPKPGTLVVMLSERIPHEVRPAARERLSLAGWFRVNPGVGGVLDPAA